MTSHMTWSHDLIMTVPVLAAGADVEGKAGVGSQGMGVPRSPGYISVPVVHTAAA